MDLRLWKRIKKTKPLPFTGLLFCMPRKLKNWNVMKSSIQHIRNLLILSSSTIHLYTKKRVLRMCVFCVDFNCQKKLLRLKRRKTTRCRTGKQPAKRKSGFYQVQVQIKWKCCEKFWVENSHNQFSKKISQISQQKLQEKLCVTNCGNMLFLNTKKKSWTRFKFSFIRSNLFLFSFVLVFPYLFWYAAAVANVLKKSG